MLLSVYDDQDGSLRMNHPNKIWIRRLATAGVLLFAISTLLAQSSSLRRVRFSRGRTTAVLKGTIVNDAMSQYVLAARAGQTMSVHVASPKNKAQFDLYPRDERSALVSEGAEDSRDWEGKLPVSGDYVISVYSTGGNTRYTLEITIRQSTISFSGRSITSACS